MARIIGVEIPGEKRIDIALRYIYGVGPTNAAWNQAPVPWAFSAPGRLPKAV